MRSVASVIESVDRQKYSVLTLGITKSGRWLYYEGPTELIASGQWESSGYITPAIISPDRSHGGILLLGKDSVRTLKVDVAFGVLHGKNGEDGTIQGLLELAGIPYVGCGVLSSALCMDKAVAHTVLTSAGIKKTGLCVVYPKQLSDFERTEKQLCAQLGYPMFVKPANSGSSVGISRAADRQQLLCALKAAFAHDDKAVVEQAVHGQEIECSVIGNATAQVAEVVGEIVAQGGFYCYDSKYTNDTAKLHIPARIDQQTAAKVREIAAKAYQVMGCRGFARVDFFVKADGDIILSEINTIPGFTSISIFPKLFEVSGVPYTELVTRLIELALEK